MSVLKVFHQNEFVNDIWCRLHAIHKIESNINQNIKIMILLHVQELKSPIIIYIIWGLLMERLLQSFLRTGITAIVFEQSQHMLCFTHLYCFYWYLNQTASRDWPAAMKINSSLRISQFIGTLSWCFIASTWILLLECGNIISTRINRSMAGKPF